jgi:hypothetical protein
MPTPHPDAPAVETRAAPADLDAPALGAAPGAPDRLDAGTGDPQGATAVRHGACGIAARRLVRAASRNH